MKKKIYMFGLEEEEQKIAQTSAEKLLRGLSKKYKTESDNAIARRRAERLTKEREERRNNTRRKPRM